MTEDQESETMNQETAQDPAPQKFLGRIKKGEVRNPTGRPKKVWTAQELMDRRIRSDLKAVAKEHSPEAFRFLLETMRDTTVGTQHRMNAATQILDRGWGKPTNHSELAVSVYDRMSEVELIKIITGEEIDATLIDVEANAEPEEQSEE